MPLYYFDIIDNGVLSRDEFGVDLVDSREAREQAQALLPDIARGGLPDGEHHVFVCEVRNVENRTVYRGCLTFHGEQFDPGDARAERFARGLD